MSKQSMGTLFAAALLAALGGCAVVPYGAPPVYVGVHADAYGRHGDDRGWYRRGYERGGYERGGYEGGGYDRGGDDRRDRY